MNHKDGVVKHGRMTPHTLTVVQCWDDGVTTDARLVDILRRFNARATFNLCAGLHGGTRGYGWMHAGIPVERLAWDELKSVYDGFTIANHSLTHPRLDQMPLDEARHQIAEGRERLQQYFGQPVCGFAYPFGAYNDAVMAMVRQSGHCYARTGQPADHPFPPQNPMALHTSCHFLAPDFWTRYENAKSSGVFYFWGHSYEMVSEAMWAAFDHTMERIERDPEASWGDLPDLFQRQSI